MKLPIASIGGSEIQEQALFSFARKNPADIVGIRFATKVTPTATFACQNVGASLYSLSLSKWLAISAISNVPFNTLQASGNNKFKRSQSHPAYSLDTLVDPGITWCLAGLAIGKIVKD